MGFIGNPGALRMNRQNIARWSLILGIAALSACGGKAPSTGNLQGAADQAALQAREAELAEREAALAAREAAAADATAPSAAVPTAGATGDAGTSANTSIEAAPAPVSSKPAAAPKPVSKPATPKPAAPAPQAMQTADKPDTRPAPPPPPVVLQVPAGTQLSLALSSDLSTKTAQPGDRVTARLTSDVLVDGRVALAQGTVVSGQVTDVVSGSRKIGGVPTLGMRFEQIELPGGGSLPIAGVVTEKGRSDTGRDTAKIVGGAAAGAILGNQIGKDDKGKVIGGILGGAIGAVAAQRTGAEVQLPAGTALSIGLTSALEVTVAR